MSQQSNPIVRDYFVPGKGWACRIISTGLILVPGKWYRVKRDEITFDFCFEDLTLGCVYSHKFQSSTGVKAYRRAVIASSDFDTIEPLEKEPSILDTMFLEI